MARTVRIAVVAAVLGPVMSVGLGVSAAAAQACSENPLDGNKGFLVLVQHDAVLTSGEADGAVAIGGNLVLAGSYRLAMHDAGRYTTTGDPRPTALYVGSRIGWPRGASDGRIEVLGQGYAKVGDQTGSRVLVSDTNGAPVTTRLVPAGNGYDSAARVELTTRQPVASVGMTGPMNIDALFAAYRNRSAAMARLTDTVTLQDANGTTLARPLKTDTNAYARLRGTGPQVLTLSTDELTHLRTVTFRDGDKPSAARPLLINVQGTGPVQWQPTQFAGIGPNEAPYLLVNIPGSVTLTMTGGSSLYATLYAPQTDLADRSPSNIDGSVVVRSLTSGTTSDNGGEIHAAPFATTIGCVTTSGATPPASPTPSTSPVISPTPSPSTSIPAPTLTPSTPTPGGRLPRTGPGNITAFAAGGLALITAGILLLIRFRRTRPSPSEAPEAD